MSTCQNNQANLEYSAEWKSKANLVRLSIWAVRSLFVRTDAWAKWNGSKQQWGSVNEKVYKREVSLSAQPLLNHFLGNITIGAYTTDPADKCCLYSGADIDYHDYDTRLPDPADNLRFALAKWDYLTSMGLYPVLEDSNGKGGYHLWLFWDRRTEAAKLYPFMRWLVRDHQDYSIGLPESFPKQAVVLAGKFGNQMRVPGKHHKREHWSSFWNGSEWLHGAAAIDYLINRPKSDPSLIPAEALAYQEAKPERKHKLNGSTWDGRYVGGDGEYDWLKNYRGDLKTLDVPRLLDEAGLVQGAVTDSPQKVRCPWSADHSGQDETGACVYFEDGRIPNFHCPHQHCETAGRDTEQFLASFGPGVVDSYCAKTFLSDQAEAAAVQREEIQIAEEEVEELLKDTVISLDKLPEAPKPKRERKLYTIEELDQLAEPGWQIENHFTNESFTLMYGDEGVGKSFVALDMGLSVSTGRPYLGKHKVRQGNVVYICPEGWGGIKRRVKAWMQHHGVTELTGFFIVPLTFDLSSQIDVDLLCKMIRERVDSVSLFIIDTISQSINGSDSDDKVMRGYRRCCNHLQERYGATVISITHTGKDASRGARGASLLTRDADSVFFFDGTDYDGKDFGAVFVSCEKQKESDKLPTYKLAKHGVDQGLGKDGKPARSLVFLPVGSKAEVDWQLLGRAKKDFLKRVYDHFGMGSFRFELINALAWKSRAVVSENLKHLDKLGLIVPGSGGFSINPAIEALISCHAIKED